MKIAEVKAFPTSFPIPAANRVALGIGTAVKRDAVVVRVSTDDGLVGWGEAHHGRAHTAVAKLIETTLKQLVVGMDAHDVNGVWERMYRFQLASHGMGAGACLAISGIDMALWDIRGKALGFIRRSVFSLKRCFVCGVSGHATTTKSLSFRSASNETPSASAGRRSSRL